jgi:hypothetical protein
MLTALTIGFATISIAWAAGLCRLYGMPTLHLRTIPVTPALPTERDLLPPPLAR